jgi:hypothetical protein
MRGPERLSVHERKRRRMMMDIHTMTCTHDDTYVYISSGI